MCGTVQTTQEGMADILDAIQKYYPGTAAAVNATLTPTAEAQLAADKAVSGGYAELAQQLNEKYAMPAAKTAANVDDYIQQAASARELDLAQGTGRELVTEADLAQRKLDPEWYAQREQLSDAMTKYLAASDPSLTENEREEMRRSMGKTAVNPASAIDTASRAMQFGEKGREKTALFGDAISRVAAATPSMRSGISGFEVATRRAIGSNTGQEKVGTPTTNAGANTYSLANNFLNTAGSLQAQRMAKQQTGLQVAGDIMGMSNKAVGGILGGI